jgi:type VI secretion system protein ImpG
MAFNKYYQDELAFLHEMGQEFAIQHPKLGRFLSEAGDDPDVERLLEGFAFLTGRLREKLEDELPELSHGLISLLWPHYLRPLPSMTIMQFTPTENAISERMVIPKGITCAGPEDDGTRCLFQTCYDVTVAPIALTHSEIRSSRSETALRLTFTSQGRGIATLGLDDVRVHLSGEIHITHGLYLWLLRFLDCVTVEVGERSWRLSKDMVRPVGFEPTQGLLPYPPNAFNGYRVLQEYFSLPEKFLFLDVLGLGAALRDADPAQQEMTLSFSLTRPLDPRIRARNDHFRLFCTPAVNLFPHDADPIALDRRRIDYLVRPAGRFQGEYTIYSVNSVEGWTPNGGGQRRYPPFESFEHRIERAGREEEAYYRLRVRQSVKGEGMDHYISFVNGGDLAIQPASETVSLDLTCCNGHRPETLRVGDIHYATESSPTFATYRNIIRPTPFVVPPLDSRLHWQLISNMSLNYLSLTDPEPLRTILAAYDFRALKDRQAERAARRRLQAIQSIKAVPLDLLRKGLPIRGLRTTMTIAESYFADEGDLYLFATVLAEFLSLYASINSFHELLVIGAETGETYRWPAKVGQQPVL